MENKNIEVVETVFNKCPVCKKGKVVFVNEKSMFIFTTQEILCNKCNAKFEWEGEVDGEDTYSLDLSESNSKSNYEGKILKRHEWEKGISDIDYQISTEKLPQLDISDTGIILTEGEKVYAYSEAQLWEERAVRYTGGGAIRVARGVYLGGSRGENQGELRKIDSGNLMLSNQRLVFNGNLRNTEYKLNKIISVEEYEDGVEIGCSNKQKVQFFAVDEPHKWVEFIKIAINKAK